MGVSYMALTIQEITLLKKLKMFPKLSMNKHGSLSPGSTTEHFKYMYDNLHLIDIVIDTVMNT